tara:strand:- start:905 stop:1096 length:192 start_codon:yes stop_codon:yes gene_type:complete
MDIYWEIDKRMREMASRHLSEDWLDYEEYEDMITFLSSAGRNDMIETINAMYPDHKFRRDHMT